jgi:hypothetical protein
LAGSDEAASFTLLFLDMANSILLLTPPLGSYICSTVHDFFLSFSCGIKLFKKKTYMHDQGEPLGFRVVLVRQLV